MEVTQFTYFQPVGGIPCHPVAVEITYGVERLAMYIQGVENIFDIRWNDFADSAPMSYADVHLQGEYEFSKYHFEIADTQMLFSLFSQYTKEAQNCLQARIPLVAYDYTMLVSHCFNVLDARKAISVAQRQDYILKIRELAKSCALLYKEIEEERNYRIQKAKG
ncbi:MAG: glycine--tRNA ligase subunit alpha, partial [Helicobacter japonicus]|nr:glycine--tRNA ligase subunit alpha [Helicobacter japonicus]